MQRLIEEALEELEDNGVTAETTKLVMTTCVNTQADEWPPAIAAQFAHICVRCLVKRKKKRLDSAQLLVELTDLLAEATALFPAPREPEPAAAGPELEPDTEAETEPLLLAAAVAGGGGDGADLDGFVDVQGTEPDAGSEPSLAHAVTRLAELSACSAEEMRRRVRAAGTTDDELVAAASSEDRLIALLLQLQFAPGSAPVADEPAPVQDELDPENMDEFIKNLEARRKVEAAEAAAPVVDEPAPRKPSAIVSFEPFSAAGSGAAKACGGSGADEVSAIAVPVAAIAVPAVAVPSASTPGPLTVEVEESSAEAAVQLPPQSATAADAAPEQRDMCSICTQRLPEPAFSKSQWKKRAGTRKCAACIADQSLGPNGAVSPLAAVAGGATGAGLPQTVVRLHVFVAEQLLDVGTTVHCRTMGGNSCMLSRCAGQATWFASANGARGAVTLFTGELRLVRKNVLHVRYRYELHDHRGTSDDKDKAAAGANNSIAVRPEWVGHQTEAWRWIDQAAANPAGRPPRLVFDDEMVMSAYPEPRVVEMAQCAVKWFWADPSLSDPDHAVQVLRYCLAAPRRVKGTHTNSLRGGVNEKELLGAIERQAQACAYGAQANDAVLPPPKPTVAAAVVLSRLLHNESSSVRNSDPDSLIQLYTFCHKAWAAKPEAVASLSRSGQEQAAAALHRAIGAMHGGRHAVRPQWLLAMPLLHALAVDQPGAFGLCGIKIAEPSKAPGDVAGFLDVLAVLQPLALKCHPGLACTAFVAAPLTHAAEVLSELPYPAGDGCRLWCEQLRGCTASGAVKLEETVSLLAQLHTLVPAAVPNMPAPVAVTEFFNDRAVSSLFDRWANPDHGTRVLVLAAELLSLAGAGAAEEVARAAQAAGRLAEPLLVRGYSPPSWPADFQSELDKWSRLMDPRLPPELQEIWRPPIQALLERRLKAYESRLLLELFCNEGTAGVRGSTRDCLVRQVTTNMKQLASQGAAALKSFWSWKGSEIPNLLSTLIEQAWENAARQIPGGISKRRDAHHSSEGLIHHVNSWEMFPHCLRMDQTVQNRLTKVSQRCLALALQVGLGMPGWIEQGQIRAGQLSMLLNVDWDGLVLAANGENPAVVQRTKEQLTLRSQELKVFEVQRTQLQTLQRISDRPDLPVVQLADAHVLHQLLEQPYLAHSICDLIRIESPADLRIAGHRRIITVGCQAEDLTLHFRSPFLSSVHDKIQPATLAALNTCVDSLLFQRKYEAVAVRRGAAPALEIGNWVAVQWAAVLGEWQTLAGNIQAGTISLAETRDLFAEAEVDDADVQKELLVMQASVVKAASSDWTRARADDVCKIRKVDRNVGKARAVVNVAETLGVELTGDAEFAELRGILSRDYDATQLSELTADLVRAFDRLEAVGRPQAEAVASLARASRLVEWLRPYQDQTQFENFTGLAFEWVEADDERELVADLHTVRNKCKKMLYDVHGGSSFRQLIEAVSDDELGETDLPKKIGHCSERLETLVDLQLKSESDVEGTSLVQAKAIYETGTLNIWCDDLPASRDRRAYALTIQHRKLTTSDGEYGDLDEPKSAKVATDLRSKLALVAGGGADSPEGVAVQRFMQLLAAGEALVDTLDKLLAAGCRTHEHDKLAFKFYSDRAIDEARTQRALLDASFTEWLDLMNQLRGNHYSLNRFRVLELTRLLELARRVNTAEHSPELDEMLTLLHCVSQHATIRDCSTCCQAVAAHAPEGRQLDHMSAYNCLDRLGGCLDILGLATSGSGTVDLCRVGSGGADDVFAHFFKVNSVNCLINLTVDETIWSILSIYRPALPSTDELLLCSAETSAEMVQMLLRRCLFNSGHAQKVFCLADVQKLSYDVQVAAVDEFERLRSLCVSQFRLVVLAAHGDTHLCNALPVYFVPKDGFDSETRMTLEDRQGYIGRSYLTNLGIQGVQRIYGRPGDGKSFSVEQSIKSIARTTNLTLPRHIIQLSEDVTRDDLVDRLVEIEQGIHATGSAPGVSVRPDPAVVLMLMQQGDKFGCTWSTSMCEQAAVQACNDLERARELCLESPSAVPVADSLAAGAPAVAQPPAADLALVEQVRAAGVNMSCVWSMNGCEKAVLNANNDVRAAIEYCLNHSEDADFDEPLRPLPVCDRVRARGEEMGYMWSSIGCERAARNARGDLQGAVDYCVAHCDGPDFDEPLPVSAVQQRKRSPQVFVLDISPTATGSDLSTILFELLCQCELRSSAGKVFHRRPDCDFFIIEHSVGPSLQAPVPAVLEWLPSSQPSSPLQCIEGATVETPLHDRWHFVHFYLSAVHGPGEIYQQRDPTVSDVDCMTVVTADMGRTAELLDPTWAQATSYVRFLHRFLEQYQQNPYCGPAVSDLLPGFAEFVVQFLKRSAADFALPSLGDSAAEDGGGGDADDAIAAYETRRRWEDDDHPYVSFIGHGFDFFGFHINQTGDRLDPESGNVLQANFMPPALVQALYSQAQGLGHARGLLVADYHLKQHWPIGPTGEGPLRAKLFQIMNLQRDGHQPLEKKTSARDQRMASYLLTADNVKKILAIMYRFHAGLPVALCGETGCGKTALVQYMCDAMSEWDQDRMLVLKVHGGTTKDDIRVAVHAAMELAKKNVEQLGGSVLGRAGSLSHPEAYTVLFLDESNTCDHQGFIKSLVVDGMLDGKFIPPALNLRCVCALNPYMKHTEAMIARLEQAGLGYSVGAAETRNTIGRTPMRHLVYRVQPLPESLKNCVWDFGRLSKANEDKYIKEIVRAQLELDADVAGLAGDVAERFGHVLSNSQQFMRDVGDECSFVSLRDIERSCTVFKWFWSKRQLLQLEEPDTGAADEAGVQPLQPPGPPQMHPATACMILATAVCYYCKLDQQRGPYLEQLASWLQQLPADSQHLPPPGSQDLDADEICAAITGCQDLDADEISAVITGCQQLVGQHLKATLPPSVAQNAALCENAFLMIVAIETRCPLFLVGKPGSSKSLAKSAVCDAMHGTNSENQFFQNLKAVQAVSYQCSPHSRSEDISEVFKRAQKFQESKNDPNFTCLVVLDEIGLAEDSEHMPLKVLHSLLEKPEQGAHVAFIGISNWALDPAKMNRGIHVNRSSPGHGDLVASARAICSHNAQMLPHVTSLANAYAELYDAQRDTEFADFFGLRDFYTLVKMLSQLPDVLTAQSLDTAVRRNFDGVDGLAGLNVRCAVFHRQTNLGHGGVDATWAWAGDQPDGVVAVWHAYSAEFSAQLEMAHLAGDTGDVAIDAERFVDLASMRQRRRDNPDRRHRAVCRTIAHAGVHCASPLELIRASLAERGVAARYLLVISQTDIASSLGLLSSHAGLLDAGADSVVIFGSSFSGDMEYQHLCRNINRVKLCMETGKCCVLLNFSSTLYASLYELLNQYYISFGAHKYVEIGLGVHRVKCRVHDNFRLVIIAEESEVLCTFPIPLLNRLEKHVLSTAGVLAAEGNVAADEAVAQVNTWARAFVGVRSRAEKALHECFVGFTEDLIPAIVYQILQTDDGNTLQSLVRAAQLKLLQLATPDAIIRVGKSSIQEQAEDLMQHYFNEQPHGRLRDYVQSARRTNAVITTHEHPVPRIEDIRAEMLGAGVSAEAVVVHALRQFDSETQFEAAVQEFYREPAIDGRRLMVMQCTRTDLKVLTCSKHLCTSGFPAHAEGTHQIIFVVHLPQRCADHSYAAAVDHWDPIHIDCIIPFGHGLAFLDVQQLSLHPSRLSDLINGQAVVSLYEDGEPEPEEPAPLAPAPATSIRALLKNSVQAALARTDFSSSGNITTVITFLLRRLVPTDDEDTSVQKFCMLLEMMVMKILRKEEESTMYDQGRHWVKMQAGDIAAVQQSGSFRAALQAHMQRKVTSAFAQTLAALNTNGNFSQLCISWWADTPRRTLFTEIASSMFSIERAVERLVQQNEQHICNHTFKSKATLAAHPFSWVLIDTIDTLRSNVEQIAAGSSQTTILECLQDELSKTTSIISGTDNLLVGEYAIDLVKSRYEVEPRVESIMIWMLLQVAVTEAANVSSHVTSAAIHCAAWTLEARLEQLVLLLSPATLLGGSAETLADLNVLLRSLGDDVTIEEIDLTVLRSVIEVLKKELITDGANWRLQYETLRTMVDSWARLSADSVTSEGADDLAEVCLDIARLRAVHLFHRIVHPRHTDRLWLAIKDADPHSPAILDQLVGLLKDMVQNAENERFPGGLECGICGNGILAKAGIALPCDDRIRHVFCAQCIEGALERQGEEKSCPRCRSVLPTHALPVQRDGDPEVVRAVERVLKFREEATQFFLEYVAEFTTRAGGPEHSAAVVNVLWPVISGHISFSEEEDELELQDSKAMRAYLLRLILVMDEGQLQPLLDRLALVTGPDLLDLMTLVMEALEDLFSQRLPASAAPRERAAVLFELVEMARPLVGWDRGGIAAQWLPAIAALRVVLFHLADELYVRSSTSTDDVAARRAPDAHMDRVLEVAAEICGGCTRTDRAPFMFLLKSLHGLHGRHALFELARPAMAEREPLAALAGQVVIADPELPPDVFGVALTPAAAGDLHTTALRLCRHAADDDIPAWIDGHRDKPVFVPMLALAVCRVAEEAFSVDQQGAAIQGAARAWMAAERSTAAVATAAGGHEFGGHVAGLVTDCLNNAVGAEDSLLRFSTEQALPSRQAMLLTIHAAAAASCSNALCAPFGTLAEVPAEIEAWYLPTMREDPRAKMRDPQFQAAARAAGVTSWNECPNGHLYAIGDCGLGGGHTALCAECGSRIGGESHALVAGNRAVNVPTDDNTPTGYDLTEEQLHTPVRDMSVAGVVVSRVVLHAVLLGAISVGDAAQRQQRATQLLRAMRGPDTPTNPAGMELFLCERLTRSVAQLAHVISRNVDAAAQLCHVALNRMLQHGAPASDTVAWASQATRRAWEQTFETVVVTPMVTDLVGMLTQVVEQLEAAASANAGQGRLLMHELQEAAAPAWLDAPLPIEGFGPAHWAQLWRWRTRITVNHFSQRFTTAAPAVRAACPAIAECLLAPNREALTALQYLPDILHLQRALVAQFERRLSTQEAAESTLLEKLEAAWGGAGAARARATLDRCVQSFLTALALVRPVLNDGVDAVLVLDDDLLAVASALTVRAPLQCFLPATTGPGKIGVALSNFLLNAHNRVVRAVTGPDTEPPVVSIRSLRTEHVVAFSDSQLLPLLFANVLRTVFEPKLGRGTRVEYDFGGVEAGLRHHFLAGKPRVEIRLGSDLPTRVAYRNDVHAGHIMARLRENVPQTALPPAVVVAVMGQLGAAQRAATLLRALEIAIGFLHNNKRGNSGGMLLQVYLKDVLMMDEDLASLLGPGPAKTVTLAHLASLVQALESQQATQEAESGRDAFTAQPDEYKQPLSPTREAELLRRLPDFEPQKLRPLLRAFVLEHLTATNLALYKPDWRLVDDLLVNLLELEPFWSALRGAAEEGPAGDAAGLKVGEAVGFWRLLVAHGGGGRAGNGNGNGSGPVAVQAGTVASRAPAVVANEPEPETMSQPVANR